ncbi:hypothetical protein AUJ66_08025 [Candidatus Desantisbacteria bacterium CG1_02_38_46]|uniref:Phosphatidate cytidylyltransferase n=3 Tax=unclassified Candidatus Desantisiibacteriota TaxID=3106372 RepID=A0A2H9P9M5_9BACT|nr:MAG: hypothetical protein AUJ66_08025 [Candidatus Desantisbacteria bacterium CG1_02_38_46]PIU51688.1 MAG: hypothetical protein COS91_03000 [Candidatus Desantisbacteria bacterium CG07_land_8_20_14_0_80_39_15]PIZ14969.1 MAG: hypothetical protein COY51_06815 [Candidatus Desantisbacteria bacterium CG_4_10_14_0_8_um_filter_39_17]
MKQLIRRKLFRMLALFYPFIYFNYTQEQTIYVSAVIAVVAMVIESARFYSHRAEAVAEKIFSPVGKGEEVERISGITYMTLGALFCVIFFPRFIAVPVLLCAIFGDAISSIVGAKYNYVKLFRSKSLEGTLVCFAICIIMNLLLLRTALVSQGLTLSLALIISLTTTLFDILPLPIDDNLSTPLATGFVAQLLIYFPG